MLKFQKCCFFSLIRGFPEHSLRICFNFTVVASVSIKHGKSVGNRLKLKIKKFSESCLWHSCDIGEKARRGALRAPGPLYG